MKLSLRQLEVIAAVAAERSISAGARASHLSQPAVTRYIREAEAIIGGRLFERVPRGVIPTTLGEAVVRHARAIRAQLRSAEEEARAILQSGAARLAVGTSIAAPSLVGRAILRLQRTRPNLTVKVIEGTRWELIPKVLSGEIDLMIAVHPELGPGEELVGRILFYNRPEVVGRWGHPLAAQKRVNARDLLAYPWVLPPPGLGPREMFENAFRRSGLTPPATVVETTSFITMRELLTGSDALAMLVREAIHVDAAAGLLKVLDLPPLRLPLRPMGIIWRPGPAVSPAMNEFVQCLVDLTAEAPDSEHERRETPVKRGKVVTLPRRGTRVAAR